MASNKDTLAVGAVLLQLGVVITLISVNYQKQFFGPGNLIGMVLGFFGLALLAGGFTKRR